MLGLSEEVGNSVTVQIQTGVDSFDHITTGHQSHGLCLTFELQSVNELVSQNGMRAELDNHGVTLGSDLHWGVPLNMANINLLAVLGEGSETVLGLAYRLSTQRN